MLPVTNGITYKISLTTIFHAPCINYNKKFFDIPQTQFFFSPTLPFYDKIKKTDPKFAV